VQAALSSVKFYCWVSLRLTSIPRIVWSVGHSVVNNIDASSRQ